MTLINLRPSNYNPVFSELWNNVYNNLSKTVGNEGQYPVPAVNITELPDSFKLEVAAPGLSKEDFKLSLEKNLLSIQVNKEQKQENENEKYIRKEFSYYNFSRSFELPNIADKDNITAQYINGVLNLVIPKKDEAKIKAVKTIEVQ